MTLACGMTKAISSGSTPSSSIISVGKAASIVALISSSVDNVVSVLETLIIVVVSKVKSDAGAM